MTPRELVAWYTRFYGDPGGRGDSENAVWQSEARLGVRLPEILSRFYRNSDLRQSAQSHLLSLEEL